MPTEELSDIILMSRRSEVQIECTDDWMISKMSNPYHVCASFRVLIQPCSSLIRDKAALLEWLHSLHIT